MGKLSIKTIENIKAIVAEVCKKTGSRHGCLDFLINDKRNS
ncbi:hypothetical protein QUF76_00130 [Desulfobacterales bacterium HSG16]|nr:hypothetical protein [Desulfobacterales bacterium HSG16]